MGNASYANLSVNTNLTGQLRSRNRPLMKLSTTVWWKIKKMLIMIDRFFPASGVSDYKQALEFY